MGKRGDEVVSVARPRPEEIRVRVRTASPRLLVVPEVDDGGWTGEANGEKVPVVRANGVFLAARVPAGESETVFRYRPPLFREGAVISALSALVVAALAWRSRNISRG